MNPLVEYQLAFNRSSQGNWEPFRSHRERLTRLLVGCAPASPGRLCVLGAGNCNDLDLPPLLAAYRELHLVDLDAAALRFGVERQGVADRRGLVLHGGVDVTGILEALAAWPPDSVLPTEAVAAWGVVPVRRVGAALPGGFDVAASACLLSQLVSALVHRLGDGHPNFLALLQAVRAGHLRLLCDLLAPGGCGVLATDVVASTAFPGLADVADADWPRVLERLARERNFFHGLNPAVLEARLRAEPGLAGVEVLTPWAWDFGPHAYLVWAARFRKAGAGPFGFHLPFPGAT
jgi:hypothetical protein